MGLCICQQLGFGARLQKHQLGEEAYNLVAIVSTFKHHI